MTRSRVRVEGKRSQGGGGGGSERSKRKIKKFVSYRPAKKKNSVPAKAAPGKKSPGKKVSSMSTNDSRRESNTRTHQREKFFMESRQSGGIKKSHCTKERSK